MRGPLPKLGFVPVILGTLLVLTAVAWSARPASHARAAAPARIASPAVPATQPVAATPVLAAKTPAPAIERAPAVSPQAAPGQAGMRAYIDPETGMLGPPTADQAALAGQDVIIDSGEGLVEERLPNGAVKMDLQGQFQEYAIMQLDANGHLVMRCIPNPKVALQNGVAPAAAPVER